MVVARMRARTMGVDVLNTGSIRRLTRHRDQPQSSRARNVDSTKPLIELYFRRKAGILARSCSRARLPFAVGLTQWRI